jgi:acyl-coenzyme A synthetase/AMP-(fatty) acid ligase/thioesterase domain-containing protein/acyl carrier protein
MAGQLGSARIGELAISLGWDRNHLLPHVEFTVPEAMARIVEQIPDAVAIDTGDEQITYADLVSRANQLANALLDRGADPSVPVALLCGHGDAPVVMITGALVAGLVAAPMDAREPPERLERFVRTSSAHHAVVAREHLDVARGLFGPEQILVLEETERYGSDMPVVEIPEDHPGLVLFTSGSTGTPKGVIGQHRGMVPRAVRTGVRNGTSVGDRHALTTSFGFTAAESRIWEVFVNGATVCTYDLRTRGARGLPEWVRREEIDVVSFVPSTLRALADVIPPGTMDCVEKAGFGAEALYYRDVRIARPLFGPDTILRHSLGSTEAGSIARYDIPLDDDSNEGPVPVGTIAPDIEVRIVDEDDQPVPDGEVGRLVVMRYGRLALGYWNDPELTRRHFFREPDGRRGFRTPDACRWRDDGLLEHVGRIDSRVKVHGAMVATSEVEVALISHSDVADAAVIAVPDEHGTRLVAYVVARDGSVLSAWKLRRDLSSRLSSTAVPSAFVALDVLPRTVRDKVDRASLPSPPPAVRPRPYRAPMGYQRDLAELFASVLGVERVGLDDDFFDLGGDSLGVVELLAAINEQFGVDLPTSAVLDAPTVDELSLQLSHRRSANASPLVNLRTGQPGDPFFCVTGAGAPAISLRELSQAMSAHNMVAIQPRGLEERARPDRTVHAAARRNVLALRARQPIGPYRLGGYSYGALVAFEMACLLEGAGEEVAILAVLDAGAPGSAPDLDLVARAATRLDRIRDDAPSGPLRRPVAIGAGTARSGARWVFAQVRYRARLATAGLVPRRGLDQYNFFVGINANMLRAYRPTTTFGGPMLLVRSTVLGPTLFPLPDGAELPHRSLWDFGWSDHVTGPITVVDVPSEHLGLLRRPAVEQLGKELATALR